MWNWIADRYKTGDVNFIVVLKRAYKKDRYPDEIIDCHCFCCEYVCQNSKDCNDCPIVWGKSEGPHVNILIGGIICRAKLRVCMHNLEC